MNSSVKEIIIALVILLFGNVTKKNKTIDIFTYINSQLFLKASLVSTCVARIKKCSKIETRSLFVYS